MTTQTTPHSEPDKRFTPDELFRVFERNKGRLQVVEYACYGLANTTGKEAACIGWVIDDVLTDLERITETLAECPGSDPD
ncbi:MAG: hypothetical protein R3F28_08850 [Candidatus Kapaibacterium sp.]|nr:hypothetical protein [Ignavibacteria bacterium]